MNINISSDREEVLTKNDIKVIDSFLTEEFIKLLRQENVKNILVVGEEIEKYVETFHTNGINAVGFKNSTELNKTIETPSEWVLSFGENIYSQLEDNLISKIHIHNTHGIIFSSKIGEKDSLTEENNKHFFSKIRNLGYVHDIEFESKIRNIANVQLLNNTITVFRKVYNYNQGDYFLCLLYNKPDHLNRFIIELPNIHDIGGYKNNYRNYFNGCTKQDFMIDIGANIGLSACPILSIGNRVVCFEPEPLNIEMLQYIKKYNNYENMYIEN